MCKLGVDVLLPLADYQADTKHFSDYQYLWFFCVVMWYFGSDAASYHTITHPQRYMIGHTSQLKTLNNKNTEYSESAQ